MENSDIKKEDKKEKSSKKTLILIFFIILLLSLATYRNFKNLRKSLREIDLPKFEVPEFEMPEFEVPSQEEKGYEEWISSDGKLKMKYPVGWIEVDSKVLEDFIQGNRGKILFSAQKFNLELNLGKVTQAFLIVQELNLEEKRSFEEIIEEMKKEVEMEILKLEAGDKIAVFEAKYKGESENLLHSKEKMILNENKVYLISFSTFEEDWIDFQKEAEEIINPVQLLE